jgi:hypothetical protein
VIAQTIGLAELCPVLGGFPGSPADVVEEFLGEMMMQILIGFGGGILLGLRWKVAVLYLVTLLVAAFMITTEGLNWQNAGLIVLVITAIQVGYICGVAARGLATRLPSVNRWRLDLHRH